MDISAWTAVRHQLGSYRCFTRMFLVGLLCRCHVPWNDLTDKIIVLLRLLRFLAKFHGVALSWTNMTSVPKETLTSWQLYFIPPWVILCWSIHYRSFGPLSNCWIELSMDMFVELEFTILCGLFVVSISILLPLFFHG